MDEITFTRRGLLKSAMLAGATIVVGASLLSCKKKPQELNCTDVSLLPPAERTAREALKYVEHSPYADKKCQNCRLFVVPPKTGNCGGCQVVKGPINPDGHCISWIAKAV